MRVLHVINSLGGSGGAEHGLVREVTSLSADIESLVVRLYEKDQLGDHLETAGVPVVSLGLEANRGGWNWPVAIWRLMRVSRAFRPHVLHSSLFYANLVAQIAGRFTGVPVLSTFTLSGDRGLLERYQPRAGSRRASMIRELAAVAARGPRVRFRALTQDAATTNCDLLRVRPSRVSVIPRGVPLDPLRSPVTRGELGLPQEIPLIVNVGRQSAQKGHRSLLEALTVVLEDRPAHLVIIGREGDASQAIRDEIKSRSVARSVTLTGYTPRVRDYLSLGSVFAFSSYMEGLGTAVVEAMAQRLPVVAFDIPPVREVTGDGRHATLVPVGDTMTFGKSILAALDGESPSVAAARQFVEDNFAIAVVADRLEDLLRATSQIR